MSKPAACTIASANYFALARTVAQSFRAQHSDIEFFILIVDVRSEMVDQAAREEGLRLFYAEDLQIQDFRSVSFKYDVTELNTNVKPTFLKTILDLGFDRVLYFDPDIYLFNSVEFIYQHLDSSNIVVTPHATSPITDTERPADLDFLATGTFNLGFIGVNASLQARRFLDWWEARCLEQAYAETRTGLFVDQKWVDLAPCYFQGVLVLKHHGCNVAHWNFHERSIVESEGAWTVNGGPLIFYHFSGIDILADTQISKHQKKVSGQNRPEVQSLFRSYRERVLANGFKTFITIPYGFARFSNGTPILSIARKVYSIYRNDIPFGDPFNADGPFYKQALKSKLLAGSDLSGSLNALNYNRQGRSTRVVNRGLRTVLKLLGGGRYTMLMKYLSFISILRNQRDVLGWNQKDRS